MIGIGVLVAPSEVPFDDLESGAGAGAIVLTMDASGAGAEEFTGTGAGAFTLTMDASGSANLFDPSFAANAVSWWDASLSANTQSGGLVSQWDDLLVAANNLTATTTARPTYTASGLNSTPELLFDGSANVLTKAFTLNNPMWMFIVFASVTYGTSGVHDILLDGNSAGAMAVGSLLSGSTAVSSGNALSDASHAVPNGTLTRMIVNYGTTGTLNFMDSGSADRTSTGSTGTNNAAGLKLGCLGNNTRFYNAKVKEVAVGTGALSAGDIASLKTYARLKHLLAV